MSLLPLLLLLFFTIEFFDLPVFSVMNLLADEWIVNVSSKTSLYHLCCCLLCSAEVSCSDSVPFVYLLSIIIFLPVPLGSNSESHCPCLYFWLLSYFVVIGVNLQLLIFCLCLQQTVSCILNEWEVKWSLYNAMTVQTTLGNCIFCTFLLKYQFIDFNLYLDSFCFKIIVAEYVKPSFMRCTCIFCLTGLIKWIYVASRE